MAYKQKFFADTNSILPSQLKDCRLGRKRVPPEAALEDSSEPNIHPHPG